MSRDPDAARVALLPCMVCAAPMQPGLQPWHRVCPACGYETADLATAINEAAAHTALDESAREEALRPLRQSNFDAIVQALLQHAPQGGRLLDVGSAHGWFVEMAQRHFSCLGIEPDEAILRASQRRGLPVRQGFFPQALKADERFDVITFNDVFEHIADSRAVLAQCARHLNHGGLLMLNLPGSQGFFYRLSKRMAARGRVAAFERMWQKGLPSPHLHYFNVANLAGLLRQSGFDALHTGHLPSLRLRGLYRRISYTGKAGAAVNTLTFLAVATTLPLQRLLPQDIFYVIARKSAS